MHQLSKPHTLERPLILVISNSYQSNYWRTSSILRGLNLLYRREPIMAEMAFDNRRSNFRLQRKPEHPWQLSIDDDLITKNIVDLSATGMSFKAPTSFNMEPGQTLNMSI